MVYLKSVKRGKKRRKQTRKTKGGYKKEMQKMNCHPAIKNKTVNHKSCFTPETILVIKEAYNHGHPKDKIISENPTAIWEELSRKLNHCEREDCWLQQLKDPAVKEKLEKYFSPKHPKKWISNPSEWLSNDDILAVLKQYEETYPNFVFIGPTMIDFDTRVPEWKDECVENRLCEFSLANILKHKKDKIGIVFNLDKHTQDGSHWVSLFIDVTEKCIFYFDSVGNQVPSEIKIFAERVMKQGEQLNPPIHFRFEETKKDHQQGDTECGMYSLFFMVTMLTGNTEFKKNMSFSEKVAFFKKGLIKDEYVKKHRKEYFNRP